MGFSFWVMWIIFDAYHQCKFLCLNLVLEDGNIVQRTKESVPLSGKVGHKTLVLLSWKKCMPLGKIQSLPLYQTLPRVLRKEGCFYITFFGFGNFSRCIVGRNFPEKKSVRAIFGKAYKCAPYLNWSNSFKISFWDIWEKNDMWEK